MTDDRQKTVDAIVAKMKSGQKLDEEYVNGYLHLARDHVLMIITTAVLKEKMPGKQVISVFNSLQNAVERHERFNGPISENSLAIGFEFDLPIPSTGVEA